mgnify:CR=1 FL=1
MKLPMDLRRRLPWLIVAAVLLVGLGCGLLYYHLNYITIGGEVFPRNIQSLDLRGCDGPAVDNIAQLSELKELDIRDTGITANDFETLRAALPGCDILWSVPFQAGAVDSNSKMITLPVLTDGDLELVQYLPDLTKVDATGCQDYPQLLALRQRYPELELSYDVLIGGEYHSCDATTLTLGTVDPAELGELLPHFQDLTMVELTGPQPDDDALFALMEAYPQVAISWDLDICGVIVDPLATEVDISGAKVDDLAALEASVLRLPNLQKVIMCGCGISNEEMDALNRRHEDIQFVWSITVRGVTLRTDITELMPYKYNLWPTTSEAQVFRYLTELECLDLGHHNIYNCDFVAYMPKLKYLLLGDTQISDLTPLEGLTELIYLELFLTEVRDYTPLLNLKKLQDLNLCYTMGEPEVVAQLTWVKYIRWITAEWGVHTREEKEMLQKALPDTLLEFGIGLSSTGGMWRKTQNYFDMRDILGMGYMTG